MASDQISGANNAHTLSEAQEQLKNFWKKTMDDIKNLKPSEFKSQELPLARIKKIMKMDEDVKMISAEAPVLFAKAAEIFINELTLRGWVHAEDNKRRTLQRNDIAMAITKYDQFDFLIDIVPREEIRPTKREDVSVQGNDQQIQYLVQFGQQAPTQQVQVQGGSVIPQQIQLIQGNNGVILTQPIVEQNQAAPQQQIIQVQAPATQQPQQQQQQQPMQVFTQVVGSNGEIQQVPIQLTANQLQQIALQMQGKQPGHPIVIQTASSVDQQNATSMDQSGHQFSNQPIFQLPIYNQNGS